MSGRFWRPSQLGMHVQRSPKMRTQPNWFFHWARAESRADDLISKMSLAEFMAGAGPEW